MLLLFSVGIWNLIASDIVLMFLLSQNDFVQALQIFAKQDMLKLGKFVCIQVLTYTLK